MAQKQKYEDELKKKQKVITLQINSMSDKVVHDRFDHDFNETCIQLGHIETLEQGESPAHMTKVEVGCAQMSHILLNLGFVSPVAQEKEQVQIANIWKAIGGDPEGQGTVPLSSVKNFARCIQNFHHQEIIDPERADPDDNVVNPRQLGRFTTNGLLFKPPEIEFISKNYREMFGNRCDKLAEEKKLSHYQRAIQKQKYGEDYLYRP